MQYINELIGESHSQMCTQGSSYGKVLGHIRGHSWETQPLFRTDTIMMPHPKVEVTDQCMHRNCQLGRGRPCAFWGTSTRCASCLLSGVLCESILPTFDSIITINLLSLHPLGVAGLLHPLSTITCLDWASNSLWWTEDQKPRIYQVDNCYIPMMC